MAVALEREIEREGESFWCLNGRRNLIRKEWLWLNSNSAMINITMDYAWRFNAAGNRCKWFSIQLQNRVYLYRRDKMVIQLQWDYVWAVDKIWAKNVQTNEVSADTLFANTIWHCETTELKIITYTFCTTKIFICKMHIFLHLHVTFWNLFDPITPAIHIYCSHYQTRYERANYKFHGLRRWRCIGTAFSFPKKERGKITQFLISSFNRETARISSRSR